MELIIARKFVKVCFHWHSFINTSFLCWTHFMEYGRKRTALRGLGPNLNTFSLVTYDIMLFINQWDSVKQTRTEFEEKYKLFKYVRQHFKH